MIAAVFKKFPNDKELYFHGCYKCDTILDQKNIADKCEKLKNLQGCEIVIKKMKGTI